MRTKFFFFLFFVPLFVFLTTGIAEALPTDLNKFQNGGTITSPPGTYSSGRNRPSVEFTNFLLKLGDFLKSNIGINVEVRGHSDSLGRTVTKKRVSQRRADYIENLLVEKSGIDKDRIIAIGFSDTKPATNSVGRSDRLINRRVDLILTRSAEAVGEITFIRNKVFTKPPKDPDFKKAVLFESLFNFYKLNTKKRSGANIKLSDASSLNIGPESLMVIYEMVNKELEDQKPEKKKKVKLLTGFLRTKLDDIRKGLNVDTPQCSITSKSKVILIDISNEAKSAVSVFDGDSAINAGNKTVSVKAGFGSFVEQGKAPSKPEPLPPAPELLTPKKREPLHSKDPEGKEVEVNFTWDSTEEMNHIQISKDKGFSSIVKDEKVKAESFKTSLPNGDYFWRVAGINKNDIEGFMGTSDFTVNIKTPLKTTPEAKSRPIDAHGSTIKVKRDKISIKGKTIPGAVVLIDYKPVTVDQNGEFLKIISLSRGWNLIKISAKHPEYRIRNKWTSVVYFKR